MIPFDFKYSTVKEWYNDQSAYVNSIDPTALGDTAICSDTVDLYEVIPYKKKEMIDQNAEISLYGDRITIKTAKETLVFPFAETLAVTLLGKNKLNIYHGDKIYQLKSGKRFNALKYVHFYHRHKNITEGDTYGKFLGL